MMTASSSWPVSHFLPFNFAVLKAKFSFVKSSLLKKEIMLKMEEKIAVKLHLEKLTEIDQKLDKK